MKQCTNCGTTRSDNAGFCGNCGAPYAESPINKNRHRFRIVYGVLALLVLCIVFIVWMKGDDIADVTQAIVGIDSKVDEDASAESLEIPLPSPTAGNIVEIDVTSQPIIYSDYSQMDIPDYNSLINSAFNAYHDLLRGEIDKYGVPERGELYNGWQENVVFAKIVDFDNDMLPEFVICRGFANSDVDFLYESYNITCYVYRYDPSSFVPRLIHETEYISHGGTMYSHLQIASSTDGRKYMIFFSSAGVDEMWTERCGTVLNGEWVSQYERTHSRYISETGEMIETVTLNGVDTSYYEFTQAKDNLNIYEQFWLPRSFASSSTNIYNTLGVLNPASPSYD